MSFQAYLDNIEAKTGKTPDDFRAMATEKGMLNPMAKASAFIDWLAADFGLGRGHAMAIVAYLRGKKD
jgi:Domain of unknown function (DUF4287)